jgi:hypothetical protein
MRCRNKLKMQKCLKIQVMVKPSLGVPIKGSTLDSKPIEMGDKNKLKE